MLTDIDISLPYEFPFFLHKSDHRPIPEWNSSVTYNNIWYIYYIIMVQAVTLRFPRSEFRAIYLSRRVTTYSQSVSLIHCWHSQSHTLTICEAHPPLTSGSEIGCSQHERGESSQHQLWGDEIATAPQEVSIALKEEGEQNSTGKVEGNLQQQKGGINSFLSQHHRK